MSKLVVSLAIYIGNICDIVVMQLFDSGHSLPQHRCSNIEVASMLGRGRRF